MAAEIFYSYCHKDEKLRNELENHLSILKHNGVVSNWHDRLIPVGSEWSKEIDEHINTADIILLLISSDFMASVYCHETEMKRAMQRHVAGEATVIPVILRPVDCKGALFEHLQAAPTDGKAVTTWQNQDEAFLDISRKIRQAVESLGHKKVEAEQHRQLAACKDEIVRHITTKINKKTGVADFTMMTFERLRADLGHPDWSDDFFRSLIRAFHEELVNRTLWNGPGVGVLKRQ